MMPNKAPKVSIIIPAYNAEKYLEATVQSAINQAYKNIEIIIVNDGSTDGTEKIIKKLVDKNPSIKTISQKNSGPGEARNIGIRNATGDFIIFLDSDDFLYQWSVEKMLDAAVSTNSDIVCGTMIESKNPAKALKEGKEKAAILEKGNYLDLLYGNIRPSPHAKLYKTSIVGNEFFSKKYYAEDLEYNLKVFKKAKNITLLIEPVIEVYTLTDGSMMRSQYNEKKQEELKILRSLLKESATEKQQKTKKALLACLFFHSVGLINSINNSQETRQKYSADFKELKSMIRKSCYSVVRDKNALKQQRRYALAACVSVDLMLKMMKRASDK